MCHLVPEKKGEAALVRWMDLDGLVAVHANCRLLYVRSSSTRDCLETSRVLFALSFVRDKQKKKPVD
jgi:hypothetical protein